MLTRSFIQIPVYAETADEYAAWLRDNIARFGDAWVARGQSREHGEAVGHAHFGTP